MNIRRNPCIQDRRLDLEGLLPRRNPGRPLPPFDIWVGHQPLPAGIDGAVSEACIRDAARALWGIAESRLVSGVRIRQYAKRRIVTVFGVLEYRISDEGRVVEGASAGFGGPRLQSGNVPIDAGLTAWGFAQTLLADKHRDWGRAVEAGLRCAQDTTSVDGTLVKAITDHAVRLVDRYLRRHVDIAGLWRRVMESMALDAEVLRMARRIEGNRRWRRGLNTSMYDSFHGLLPALLEVERLEPSLTPLAWASRHQWSKRKIPPLKYLREALAQRHCDAADWRRLRTTLARPVWDHWCQNKIRGVDRLLDFMADWARVHRGLPDTARMPGPMWDLLARTSVEPLEDRLTPPVAWPCRPAVLRGALDTWSSAEGPTARRAFVEGDWARVVRWSAHYGSHVPLGRKTTWPAVLAAANEDERRRLASAQATSLRWRSPIEAFTSGPLRVVPLTDPLALTDEAIALRHCADTFQEACASGTAYLFSFRDARTGRRVATLALSRIDGEIEVDDLRRMANQAPTEQDEALAERVLERVRDALAGRTPPDDRPDGTPKSPQRTVDELLIAITGRTDLPMAPDTPTDSADARRRRFNMPYVLDAMRRHPRLTIDTAFDYLDSMGF